MRHFTLFFLLISMFACGSNQATKQTNTKIDSSRLFVIKIDSIEQSSYDTIKLGKVVAGEVLESHFIIENDSKNYISINNIITGCGCVSADYDKSPLKPQEKRIYTIKYDSKGQFGSQIKAVEIVPSDYNVKRIYITCNVD